MLCSERRSNVLFAVSAAFQCRRRPLAVTDGCGCSCVWADGGQMNSSVPVVDTADLGMTIAVLNPFSTYLNADSLPFCRMATKLTKPCLGLRVRSSVLGVCPPSTSLLPPSFPHCLSPSLPPSISISLCFCLRLSVLSTPTISACSHLSPTFHSQP